MVKTISKTWILFDLFLVAIACFLFIIDEVSDAITYSETIFCFLLGSVLMFSKKLKDKSYIYRFAFWVTDNIFKPRTRFNHLIWGMFFIIFGVVALLFASPSSYSETEFIENIQKTKEFWVGIGIVILFNIIVGLYTASCKRRNSEDGARS